MLEMVAAAPPDPILGLSEAFRQDTNPHKINLTIGVYRDAAGQTPVLTSVKKAEQRLLQDETTKGYLGIDGLPVFLESASDLSLGQFVSPDRVVAFQTPGGTGALRVAADFLAKNFRGARIWHSSPTWPNHPSIFQAARLEPVPYPYLAADRRTLDFESMLETLDSEAKAGDVLCLHACCHNPTGVDPTDEQWAAIAELSASRGLLPLVDFAYHGFGDGLQEDLRGLRALASTHPEFLVCTSYSKNFGLYSERIGALFAVCGAAEQAAALGSNIKSSVRCNYSNPPRHGGAVVATILQDAELRTEWEQELTGMRQRIHAMRESFVQAMADRKCAVDFSFLLNQRGMFSFSGLTPLQVDWLKKEKGIYIVGSGRINVAGITPDNLDYLADGIHAALGV